jgi:hypothetical protein
MNVWIDYFVFKIEPDALVVPAIVASAWYRSVLPHGAAARATLEVCAVSVFVLSDEVWPPQVPLDNSLIHVLFG